jgi:hypothetical protein
MISLRFLPRENWEPRLRYYRCKPIDGVTPLNTAEWWVTEWGFTFTVPVEANDCCHQDALQRLVADIVRSAPLDTRFPGPDYVEPLVEEDATAEG